jgi:hypothetical protein
MRGHQPLRAEVSDKYLVPLSLENRTKTHVEQASVTEGRPVFGDPTFMRQCVFWVEPKFEVA